MNKFIAELVGATTSVTVPTGFEIDSFVTIIILLFSFGLPIAVFVSILMRGEKKDKREEKEEAKEKKEETQKDSSSSSVLRSANNALSNLVWFAIIIAFIFLVVFLIGKVSYKAMDMLDTFFASMTDTSKVQEKTEWLYCQKGKLDDEFECDFKGNMYKVEDFKYTPEGSSFDVCWNFGCTEFKSDIGSPSTGSYRNRITGEEGRYSGLEKAGTGFSTASVVCKKNCQKDRDLFTIDKE